MIQIDGRHLTWSQIKAVACDGERVKISREAWERVREAEQMLVKIRETQTLVYGLNTGVGWNKDRAVAKDTQEYFNRNLLLSHNVGAGELCAPQEVRAAMLLRLNSCLNGRSGLSEAIVGMLCEFLNQDVVPVVHQIGSVGEADIGLMASIGLCMIGEGNAYVGDQCLSGRKLLEVIGREPIQLGPKGALGIVSSNALSAGIAALAIGQLHRIWHVSLQIYGLYLEGYDAVLDPIEERVNEIRRLQGQQLAAAYCRECLKGSYLYEKNEKRAKKALQDPLSIRDEGAVSGAFKDALEYVEEKLSCEINTSGDNPCVIAEEERIIGSANFEPLTWVLGLEMLLHGLGHLSSMVMQRIIKIDDPDFSGLGRFLSPDEAHVIAFSTIQKTCAELDARIRACGRCSSLDQTALAGEIEDHATNAMMIVRQLKESVRYYTYLLAIELMHAAQAVDLRKVTDHLGGITGALYRAYRDRIPFLSEDRDLSQDIERSYKFMQDYIDKAAI